MIVTQPTGGRAQIRHVYEVCSRERTDTPSFPTGGCQYILIPFRPKLTKRYRAEDDLEKCHLE